MTWGSLVWKNLLRRRARTGLTALGVGLGVGLIVALLAITAGVHRTAEDLIHVGRADFGLFQADVNDFTRSNLPQSLAAKVARDPGDRPGGEDQAARRTAARSCSVSTRASSPIGASSSSRADGGR